MRSNKKRVCLACRARVSASPPGSGATLLGIHSGPELRVFVCGTTRRRSLVEGWLSSMHRELLPPADDISRPQFDARRFGLRGSSTTRARQKLEESTACGVGSPKPVGSGTCSSEAARWGTTGARPPGSNHALAVRIGGGSASSVASSVASASIGASDEGTNVKIPQRMLRAFPLETSFIVTTGFGLSPCE